MTTGLTSRVALLALVTLSSMTLQGCFGSTNAVVGKWSLGPQNPDGCPDSMEFTETAMTAGAAGISASHDVTYKADGGNIDISSPDGFVTTVTVNGNSLTVLQPVQCTYARAQ